MSSLIVVRSYIVGDIFGVKIDTNDNIKISDIFKKNQSYINTALSLPSMRFLCDFTQKCKDYNINYSCANILSSYILQDIDYKYEVCILNYINNLIYYSVYNGRVKTLIYNGSLDKFGEIHTKEYMKNMQGKMVRFEYSGGTSSGKRIVMVEKIGYYNFAGKDLTKPANDNYRCFSFNKIIGNIEVLN